MLKWPHLPENAHVRTCQECDYAQVAKNPAETKGDSWRDLKCKKCKSEGSLDYGSTNVHEIDEE